MSDPSTASLPEGQGAPAEPVAPAQPAADPAGSVQSPDPAQEQSQEPAPAEPSGQDLIAPYLEGVDPNIREAVAERLERFRQDTDANVNKRFEKTSTELKAYKQLAEDPAALETPVALYENLLQDPEGTLEWVVEQFQQEMGVDLRAKLLEKWVGQQRNPAEPEPTTAPTNDEDRPLTVKEWQRLQQEQAAQSQQEQQAAEARQRTEGWLNTAASQYGIELGEGDVVLKEAILRQAATLMPSVRDGEKAIQMAVEAMTTRFAPKKDAAPASQAPRTANGGGPATASAPDFTDQKQRREAMLAMLTAAQNPTT